MPDLNIEATQQIIVIIGDSGGDGGATILTPNGLKKVPDNNPELRKAYETLVKSYAVLEKAALGNKVVGR